MNQLIRTGLLVALSLGVATVRAQQPPPAPPPAPPPPMPQILQNYAVGPLGGVAYNLTLLSYNHSLDMGVNIDTAAVTEPELLRECLEKAFADLLSA